MQEPFFFPFQAMGTACSFRIFAENEELARKAAQAGAREAYRLEGKYSRYDPESYLSEINHVALSGGFVDVDEETAWLIDEAFIWHEMSDGLFDITSGVLRRIWNFKSAAVPSPEAIAEVLAICGLEKLEWQKPVLSFPVPGMEIDLGGIVKEYAADRAGQAILQNGGASALVELGGDIAVAGERPDAAPWQIGISKPGTRDEAVNSVLLASGGLATSGDYERYFELGGKRYSHILNPKTGWPVEGIASSITVTAESCLKAGQYSTMALLKGPDGLNWLDGLGVIYFAIKKKEWLGTTPSRKR